MIKIEKKKQEKKMSKKQRKEAQKELELLVNAPMQGAINSPEQALDLYDK